MMSVPSRKWLLYKSHDGHLTLTIDREPRHILGLDIVETLVDAGSCAARVSATTNTSYCVGLYDLAYIFNVSTGR